MSYVALSDLAGRIPEKYLTDALDDDADGSTAAWDSVASSASDAVDASLSTAFSVPFTDPAPAVVKFSAIIFACEMIYSRRGIANEQNPFYAQAQDMREKLARIAMRKEPLEPGKLPVVKSGGVIVEAAPTFSGAGRRMT
jgi:hypothetical protein